MSFQEFIEESKSIVLDSLDKLGYGRPKDIVWLEPPDQSLGDVAFRVAFDLSKRLGRNPGEIAESLANQSTELVSNSKFVASLSSHPSGFLNAKIKMENFGKQVLESARGKDYGATNIGQGKPILVEHTSVNPNKALHVGHLRNVAIGDCLRRVFSFAGYDAYVLNYIDDSGLQVADIIVGFNYLGFSKESPAGEKYDQYAGDTVYVTVTKKYETDPSLKDKQKSVLQGIESNDPSISKLRMEVTDRIIKEQLKTCWRFGARYDLFIYESDIIHSNLWSTVFESLKKKGIVRLETEGKLEGCWVVTVEGETEGEEKVLVRSDGTATYVAKDIPTAALKIALVPDPFKYSFYTAQPDGTNIWRTMVGEGERNTSPVRWGSENLTLIDSRQARLQRIVQYILAKSSGEDIKSKYGYVAYAIISLSPKTASALSITSEESEGEQQKVVTMSGRHGTYVNADDAMDLVKEKALEETKKRNPTVENPDWFDGVAEKLAISAIRFSILKQDLDKMIVFDSEESLKLIGETGPYLLYTYARASSVLSKLDASKRNSEEPLIQTPEEIALLKTISKFSLSVEKTVKNLAPKWLAHYTYALSESFNSFYEVNRIIQEPNERTRNSRIELTKATRSVLASCLYLLGIEASERI